MKRYKCHKVVQAFKITLIETDIDSMLSGDGGEKVLATFDWCQKHNPQVGGYFVRYEDGYESYSPAKAFEDGYTEIKDENVPAVPSVEDSLHRIASNLYRIAVAVEAKAPTQNESEPAGPTDKETLIVAGDLYDRYKLAVGGVAYDGKPLPTWEEFLADENKKKQVKGWVWVAQCAMRRGMQW